MLRQLVDSFIQSDLSEQEDEATSDIDDGSIDSIKQTEATSNLASESNDSSRSTSSNRRRSATLSDQSFGKVGVKVKLADQQRVASFDIKTPNNSDGVSQIACLCLQEIGYESTVSN